MVVLTCADLCKKPDQVEIPLTPRMRMPHARGEQREKRLLKEYFSSVQD